MVEVKFTTQGIAVPSGDTHLGPWIQRDGKLCTDSAIEVFAKQNLKVGDWVVDAGANIGDHTVAYLAAVGDSGKVFAFDPHPEAVACCILNCPKAFCFGVALWSNFDLIQFSAVSKGNVGGSHVSPEVTALSTTVYAMPLDALKLPRLDLFKLDIEGAEYEAIVGAMDTIRRCRPVILMEVNAPCLSRLGSSYQKILDLLNPIGYVHSLLNPAYGLEQVQTDVVLRPK